MRVTRVDRQVRDRWLADGTHERFGVLANAWKETVRDAMADIAANRAAAMVKVRRAIRRHTADPGEQKRLYGLLKAETWASDPYLARQMRRHWRRGKNRTHNQIVVRADQHNTQADAQGRLWLAVPGLTRRRMVRVPLDTTVAPVGTLRLVNAAYTSQVVPCCQVFGRRNGDRLHCTGCGVVWCADHAAAINVEARDGDPDIALYTPHRVVRQILLRRADRHRTRLPVLDSSRGLPGGERIIRTAQV